MNSLTIKRLVRTLTCLLALGCSVSAHAHQFSMAVLTLKEVVPKQYSAIWSVARGEQAQAFEYFKPYFPEGCILNPPQLDCRSSGLEGVIGFAGLGSEVGAAVLRITNLSGESRSYTLTKLDPQADLITGMLAGGTRIQVLKAYTMLGVEHILIGVDHLLFILGLLWLVGSRWMLLKTVTAFTLAHSITLSAASLNWVGLPAAPVEAAIALSLVFVAAETIYKDRGRLTLCVRYPWFLAFCFGLLHGFGFAGALAALGLPADNIPLALVSFNIGVELGQLAFIGLVLVMVFVVGRARLTLPFWGKLLPQYAVGTLAVFWLTERLLAFQQ